MHFEVLTLKKKRLKILIITDQARQQVPVENAEKKKNLVAAAGLSLAVVVDLRIVGSKIGESVTC